MILISKLIRKCYRTAPEFISWRIYRTALFIIKSIAPQDYSSVVLIKNSFRMSLNLNGQIDARIFLLDEYEPGVCRIFDRYLSEGDRVLDIGANIGFFSLYAAAIHKAEVFSVEASEQNYRLLQNNRELNPQLSEQIRIFRFAAWDCRTQLQFSDLPDAECGKSHLGDDPQASRQYQVRAQPTDELGCPAKLIKIDIEGAELHALKGLKQTIFKYSPIIIAEISPDFLARCGSTLDELLDFLVGDFRYQMFEILYCGREVAIDAERIKHGGQFNILFRQ